MTPAEETVWSEDFAPNERDKILTKVRLGELTPKEAEELARSKGLEPFAVRPDPALHDPMSKPNWTLTMALAWISSRDLKKVAHWDKDYRDKCLDWFLIRVDALSPWGHELRPLSSADARRLEDEETAPIGEHVVTIDRKAVQDAREGLWSALLEGKITAEAIPAGERRRVPVPAYEWQDMTTARADGLGLERLIFKLTPSRDAYLDPRFPRDEILAIWKSGVIGAADGQSAKEMSIRRAPSKTVHRYAQDYFDLHGLPPTQAMGREFARQNRYAVKAFEAEMRNLPQHLRLPPGTKQAFANLTSAEN